MGRRPQQKQCRAVYDCEADHDDELTFSVGDIITIVEEEVKEEYWCWRRGFVRDRPGKIGLFPYSFVEMIVV